MRSFAVPTLILLSVISMLCRRRFVRKTFFRRLDLGVAAISGALLELIFIRNSTMSLSLGLDSDDVCSFIQFLCTSCTIS